jgi:hypothetical protein
VKSMTSEFHNYDVGDMVILNANTSKKDPQYYIVKIIHARRATSSLKDGVTTLVPQKYEVEYADGDSSEIERTLSDIRNEDYEDIVGLAIPGKVRKSSFGKANLHSYLLVEKEAPAAPKGSPKPLVRDVAHDDEDDEELDEVVRKPATLSFGKKDLIPPKKALIKDNFHVSWRVIHDVNAKEVAIRKVNSKKKELEWVPKHNVLDIKVALEDDLVRDSLDRVISDVHATTIKDRRASWRSS